VLLDDFQFKRQSWQQRYEIWMHDHPYRLTIPVNHEDLFKPINQVKTAPGQWREKHLKTLKQCYGNTPFYREISERVAYSYEYNHLSDINLSSIWLTLDYLGIDTPILHSSSLGVDGKATEYLVNLCTKLGADTYLSGGTAYNSYMELDKFKEAGITVQVQKWDCRHDRGDISILDPLMRYGEETLKWIE